MNPTTKKLAQKFECHMLVIYLSFFAKIDVERSVRGCKKLLRIY